MRDGIASQPYLQSRTRGYNVADVHYSKSEKMIFKSSNSQRLNTGIHTAPRYQLSPYYEPQIWGFFDTHGSSPQTEEIYPVISLYYIPGLICLFSMTFGFVKRCGTGYDALPAPGLWASSAPGVHHFVLVERKKYWGLRSHIFSPHVENTLPVWGISCSWLWSGWAIMVMKCLSWRVAGGLLWVFFSVSRSKEDGVQHSYFNLTRQ